MRRLRNNYCEANIKPFATARRAWLFADTPKGAFANGVLYTLVESARANDLDVYEYLKHLLTEMPNNHHLENPSVIDQLLPWSKELPFFEALTTELPECGRNKGIDRECTTAVTVVRVLGGKFLKVHIFADL